MRTCCLPKRPISGRNRNLTGSADLLPIYSLLRTLPQIRQLSWPEHYFLWSSLSSCARTPCRQGQTVPYWSVRLPCVLTQTDWPATFFVHFFFNYVVVMQRHTTVWTITDWQIETDQHGNRATKLSVNFYRARSQKSILRSQSYISQASTLNTDDLLWYTQLIVCAVKY